MGVELFICLADYLLRWCRQGSDWAVVSTLCKPGSSTWRQSKINKSKMLTAELRSRRYEARCLKMGLGVLRNRFRGVFSCGGHASGHRFPKTSPSGAGDARCSCRGIKIFGCFRLTDNLCVWPPLFFVQYSCIFAALCWRKPS
jgi:hypothetical protein